MLLKSVNGYKFWSGNKTAGSPPLYWVEGDLSGKSEPISGVDVKAFGRSRRREAFSEFVRIHGGVMVTLARRQVGAGEAEDVVQASLASAWEHFRVSEMPQHPRAWLLRFLTHECRNRVARRARQPAAVEFDEELSGPIEDIVTILQKELAYSSSRNPQVLLEYLEEDLSRAVQAITEAERMTLMLRAVGELSYKEISETMGVPIGTVMSRLCRAREKVRVELERKRDSSLPDISGRKSEGKAQGRLTDGTSQ